VRVGGISPVARSDESWEGATGMENEVEGGSSTKAIMCMRAGCAI